MFECFEKRPEVEWVITEHRNMSLWQPSQLLFHQYLGDVSLLFYDFVDILSSVTLLLRNSTPLAVAPGLAPGNVSYRSGSSSSLCGLGG